MFYLRRKSLLVRDPASFLLQSFAQIPAVLHKQDHLLIRIIWNDTYPLQLYCIASDFLGLAMIVLSSRRGVYKIPAFSLFVIATMRGDYIVMSTVDTYRNNVQKKREAIAKLYADKASAAFEKVSAITLV